eukprot:gene10082-12367_t
MKLQILCTLLFLIFVTILTNAKVGLYGYATDDDGSFLFGTLPAKGELGDFTPLLNLSKKGWGYRAMNGKQFTFTYGQRNFFMVNQSTTKLVTVTTYSPVNAYTIKLNYFYPGTNIKGLLANMDPTHSPYSAQVFVVAYNTTSTLTGLYLSYYPHPLFTLPTYATVIGSSIDYVNQLIYILLESNNSPYTYYTYIYNIYKNTYQVGTFVSTDSFQFVIFNPTLQKVMGVFLNSDNQVVQIDISSPQAGDNLLLHQINGPKKSNPFGSMNLKTNPTTDGTFYYSIPGINFIKYEIDYGSINYSPTGCGGVSILFDYEGMVSISSFYSQYRQGTPIIFNPNGNTRVMANFNLPFGLESFTVDAVGNITEVFFACKKPILPTESLIKSIPKPVKVENEYKPTLCFEEASINPDTYLFDSTLYSFSFFISFGCPSAMDDYTIEIKDLDLNNRTISIQSILPSIVSRTNTMNSINFYPVNNTVIRNERTGIHAFINITNLESILLFQPEQEYPSLIDAPYEMIPVLTNKSNSQSIFMNTLPFNIHPVYTGQNFSTDIADKVGLTNIDRTKISTSYPPPKTLIYESNFDGNTLPSGLKKYYQTFKSADFYKKIRFSSNEYSYFPRTIILSNSYGIIYGNALPTLNISFGATHLTSDNTISINAQLNGAFERKLAVNLFPSQQDKNPPLIKWIQVLLTTAWSHIIKIRITDNFSGFYSATLGDSIVLTQKDLVSGNFLDGIYVKEIPFTEKGDPKSQYKLTLYDRCLNNVNYEQGDGITIDSSVPIFSTNYPTQITLFKFKYQNVDTTNIEVENELHFSLTINDPLFRPVLEITLPNQYILPSFIGSWNSTIGLYVIPFKLLRNMVPGEVNYKIYSRKSYYVNSAMLSLFVGQDSVLTVDSELGDSLPPIVTNIQVLPTTSVTISSTTEIKFILTIEDYPNGIKEGILEIKGDADLLPYQFKIVKGSNPFKIEYEASITLESTCFSQTYSVHSLTLVDESGANWSVYNTTEKSMISPFFKVVETVEFSNFAITTTCVDGPTGLPSQTIVSVTDFIVIPGTGPIDVGSNQRNISFSATFSHSTGISNRHQPTFYLEALLFEIIECNIVKREDLSATSAKFTCEMTIPFGFGGSDGFIASVYGAASNSLIFGGIGQLGAIYITTTFNPISQLPPPLINNYYIEKLNDSYSITLLGKNFGTGPTIQVKESSTSISFLSYEPNDASYAYAIIFMEKVPYSIRISRSGILSNEVFLVYKDENPTPTPSPTTSTTPSPTPTPTPTPSPTSSPTTSPTPSPSPTQTPSQSPSDSSSSEQPVKCLGTPPCSGNGVCEFTGCACNPPYYGPDCTSSRSPSNDSSTKPNEPTTTVKDDEIDFSSIISIIEINELDLSSKKPIKNFPLSDIEWDRSNLTKTDSTYGYKYSYSTILQGTNQTKITVEVEWTDKNELLKDDDNQDPHTSDVIIGISVPYFVKEVLLDPDFSLLFETKEHQDSTTCTSNGLSKTKLAGIIVGCSVFAIAAAITSIVAYRQHRIKKLNMKNLQMKLKNVN